MNEAEKFEKLRKKYNNIKPPFYLQYYGWENLRPRLETEVETKAPKFSVYKGAVFASFLMILSVSFLGAVQAAAPDSALGKLGSKTNQFVGQVTNLPIFKDVENETKRVPPASPPKNTTVPTFNPTAIPSFKPEVLENKKSVVKPTLTPKPTAKATSQVQGIQTQTSSASSTKATSTPKPTVKATASPTAKAKVMVTSSPTAKPTLTPVPKGKKK